MSSSNLGKSHEWIEGLTSSHLFWLRFFREMIWTDAKKGKQKQLGIFFKTTKIPTLQIKTLIRERRWGHPETNGSPV